jgi:hypothetical protein
MEAEIVLDAQSDGRLPLQHLGVVADGDGSQDLLGASATDRAERLEGLEADGVRGSLGRQAGCQQGMQGGYGVRVRVVGGDFTEDLD